MLQGTDLLVKSPGVPGETRLVAGAHARHSRVERDRARRAAASEPDSRRHRDERKDDDVGAPRCDLRAAGRPGRGRGQHRPPADLARRLGRAGHLDRLRAVVLPARGRRARSVLASRCSSTSSRTISTGTARSSGTWTRSSASSRQQTEDDTAVLPRGFGPVPGAARRVEFRRDDPLPAEPRIPGPHNRENAAAATAAARVAGIADDAIAEALRTFPGVPASHRARSRGRAASAT